MRYKLYVSSLTASSLRSSSSLWNLYLRIVFFLLAMTETSCLVWRNVSLDRKVLLSVHRCLESLTDSVIQMDLRESFSQSGCPQSPPLMVLKERNDKLMKSENRETVLA